MRLYKEYNKTDAYEDGVNQADVARARVKILKCLLGDVQGIPDIDTPFSVLYGCNTSLGRNFYGNVGWATLSDLLAPAGWHNFGLSLTIDDSAFVTIGDDVTIGPDVRFITLNHPTDVTQRLQDVMYAHPIAIGSACWIGARATILPGATVGYGSTIGAGAVVSGNIPEYSVAVGVPARVIKRVFPKLPASSAASALEICDTYIPKDENDGVTEDALLSMPKQRSDWKLTWVGNVLNL